MRRLLSILIATAAFTVGPVAASLTIDSSTPASAATADLTVMTRNLYLGADVDDALTLLPDTSAAAQSLWDQVSATDFTARVGALASEAATAKPSMIGLQEGTTWVCTPDSATPPTSIFDFTAAFLDATNTAGTPYVIARAGDSRAVSDGFSIGPLVGLTIVRDPARFRPLFGSDTASCGFRTSDVLLVRADLASSVTAAGSTTYARRTEVLPGLVTVQRGYAWADITVGAGPVRVATTHLEAYWRPGEVPAMVDQARELIAALAPVTTPLVVMGDFNADPRDPRPAGVPNPGGQPTASTACDGRTCTPYWSMIDAGYTDAGPDSSDPRNFTWGADASLAGPSIQRLAAAQALGNTTGFTDRLDYVFTRNGATATDASLVGNSWPVASDVWTCSSPAQIANTAAAARAMGVAVPDGGRCFATDHAGIVATIAVPSGPSSGTTGWWVYPVLGVVGGIVAVAIVGLIRRRRAEAPVPRDRG